MKTEWRLKILGVMFALGGGVILARLFYWQVMRSGDLAAQARVQHLSRERLWAHRGSILAADGSLMAVTNESWLVYADLTALKDGVRAVANRLAPFLIGDDGDKEELLAEAMRLEGILTREKVMWVPLKSKVTAETKRNIEAMAIGGIGFELEETRVYPEGSSSAQLMGFVGKDEEGNDQGYFGLEGFYDLLLAGKPGFLEREANAAGIPLVIGESKETTALRGVDLGTRIDKTIQRLVEEKLEEGIERYGAKAGSVVVMEPEEGGIMAMASSPYYDPVKYQDYGDEYFKNPVISDTFEPGSVFKPVVMAAALDAGAVKPETECTACGEPLKVDKYVIRTWDDKYFEKETMTEVIVHSDNVGMAFVGEKLGAEKMHDYLEKFGFGEVSGVDLQGEVSGNLRKRGSWNVVDLATTSFGQGIAVTPIQMVRAIAVIARGGLMIKPRVVDKMVIDGWEEVVEPEEGERVISKKAAEEITEMMILAAKQGEAKWTALRGFRVAGKTGTAQIPVAGHYDEEKTIASFVGFAPAERPKFVMLVTLREPQSSPWASETAAPMWFSIAKELFLYLGIQPED